MTIYVRNENERIGKTVEYIKNQLKYIEYAIKDCDYDEDINGRSVYAPSFSSEKRILEDEKYALEQVLDLLTMKTPFCKVTL